MKPRKLHPALLGGLFIGVVSALPYVKEANACCCLWMAVGGFLAAYVMQQNHVHQVSLGDGAAVGLLAGLAGFVIMLVVSVPIAQLVPPHGRDLSQGVLGTPEGMNPEVRELVRNIPPVVLAIFGGLMFLGIGSIVSMVGGIVGAAFFRRSVPPAPPEPPMSHAWVPPIAEPPPPPSQPPVPPAALPPGEPGSNEPSS